MAIGLSCQKYESKPAIAILSLARAHRIPHGSQNHLNRTYARFYGCDQQILCDKKTAFKKIFSCNNKEIVITSNGLNVNTKRSCKTDFLVTVFF